MEQEPAAEATDVKVELEGSAEPKPPKAKPEPAPAPAEPEETVVAGEATKLWVEQTIALEESDGRRVGEALVGVLPSSVVGVEGVDSFEVEAAPSKGTAMLRVESTRLPAGRATVRVFVR